MQILIVILLALLIGLLAGGIWLLLSAQKRMEYAQNDLYEQNREAGLGSQSLQREFELLQQQVQLLSRSQASGNQNLDAIQEQVSRMAMVMNNNKQRGTWGEYQLENLLAIYAGDHPRIYEMQYRLENGRIADAALHLAGTDRVLCVDSKFPMENYLRLCEDPANAAQYDKALRQNVKKHIDDIADKYITPQTADQAVLFLPGEAVYQYICSRCEDIFRYALGRHVLITSPTTLSGILFTLQAGARDYYRAEHLQEMEKHLLLVKEDVDRLAERLEKARRSLNASQASLEQAAVSARKTAGRFEVLLEGRNDQYGNNSEGGSVPPRL